MQEFAREEAPGDAPILKEAARAMALLLQPLAPHISEELWAILGGRDLALRQAWPAAEPFWLVEEEIDLVVQVNGRVRGHLRVARDLAESEAVGRARADARLAPHLEGRTTRKIVYLPGRLLNIVVG
jgi:leucyl-tRNA synthetase